MCTEDAVGAALLAWHIVQGGGGKSGATALQAR